MNTLTPRATRGRWALAMAAGLSASFILPAGAGAITTTDPVASSGRFTASSWWNTPLQGAPVDSHSAQYIADSLKPANTQNYLKLVLGDFANPVYYATASDPVYTIDPSKYGPTVSVHIPAGALQQPSSDSELTVYDPSTDQVVGLWQATYTGGHWTAGGLDRYALSSDGITAKSGGIATNLGHRGVPSAIRAVERNEVAAGAINHRLAISWYATASSTPTGARAYWPMSGSESGKDGIVPEGIVVRIKASVDLKSRNLSPAALVVATALQKYGAIIADNSGSGNNLKLQQNASWTGVLDANSLQSIPWSDYEFVQGGYPHTN